MSEIPIPEELVHSIEGPQQKIQVTLSKNEYFKHVYPNVEDPSEYATWVLNAAVEKLPEGTLKEALELSNQEFKARRERQREDKTYNLYDSNSLVDGSEQYAFRAVKRRSDGGANLDHEEATLASLDQNIFEEGIDYVGFDSVQSINPSYAIPAYSVTNQVQVGRGEDVSVIQIYKNEPFVVQLPDDKEQGNNEALLVNLNNGSEFSQSQRISLEEAKEYPTLRDNFLGSIEITIE